MCRGLAQSEAHLPHSGSIQLSGIQGPLFQRQDLHAGKPSKYKTLLAISQHRDLAKSVRLLRFSLCGIRCRHWTEHGRPSYRTNWLSEPRTRDPLDDAPLWRRVENEQWFYIHNRTEMEQDLINILRNFLSYGVAPGIVAMAESLFSQRAAWGLQRLKRALGDKITLELDGNLRGVYLMKSVLTALSVTRYPAQELVLGSESQLVHFEYLAKHRINPKNLRKIDICLHVCDEGGFSPRQMSSKEQYNLVAGLLLTLARATKLQHLALAARHEEHGEDGFDEQVQVGIMKLNKLPEHGTRPKLQTFCLDGFKPHSYAIERIVEQHISTLNELVLKDMHCSEYTLRACEGRIKTFFREQKPGDFVKSSFERCDCLP